MQMKLFVPCAHRGYKFVHLHTSGIFQISLVENLKEEAKSHSAINLSNQVSRQELETQLHEVEVHCPIQYILIDNLIVHLCNRMLKFSKMIIRKRRQARLQDNDLETNRRYIAWYGCAQFLH